MKRTYLDYSATTPIDKEVLKAMQPYLAAEFGNASSLHTFGQRARAGVEMAREQAAKFLGCEPKEIFFTSGATESNNLAIFGLARRLRAMQCNKTFHIITSAIEHPAVLEPCRQLEKEGVEITYLPVTKSGLIKVDDVQKAIRPDTVLVSIMYVNNEIGTIQPIKEIGELIKKINETREPKNKIYFHTDAAQAATYCDCRVNFLGVDLLSLSAHKIYGPKGVGVLYIRGGTPLWPLQYGGHQERGMRSGTENVAGIVGLGKAIELLSKKLKALSTGRQVKSEKLRIKKLRDKLVKEILKKIPNAILNGDLKQRVPSNANFCFKNVEGESILLMLDMEGIAVSTGSACSSGSLEPSHVLTAIGVSPEISHGSLRMTLGKFTTEKDIDKFLKILPGIISKLRKISPIK